MSLLLEGSDNKKRPVLQACVCIIVALALILRDVGTLHMPYILRIVARLREGHIAIWYEWVATLPTQLLL